MPEHITLIHLPKQTGGGPPVILFILEHKMNYELAPHFLDKVHEQNIFFFFTYFKQNIKIVVFEPGLTFSDSVLKHKRLNHRWIVLCHVFNTFHSLEQNVENARDKYNFNENKITFKITI